MKGFPVPHLIRPIDGSNSSGHEAAKVTSGMHSLGREGALEEEDEECRVPVVIPRPIAPTKAQLDEHFPLHLHYRSWCKACVFG